MHKGREGAGITEQKHYGVTTGEDKDWLSKVGGEGEVAMIGHRDAQSEAGN